MFGLIVCWGWFRQLLVGGTQLGQGVNPVREDSLAVCSRIGGAFRPAALAKSVQEQYLASPGSSDRLAPGYGIIAVAWFESTLSTLFESTAVTT